MTDIFSWPDSELLSLSPSITTPGALVLILSAAAVVRLEDGRQGAASRLDGFLRPLVITLHEARVQGSPLADCIGTIAQGEWQLASGHTLKELPVPWQCAQALVLHLSCRNASTLRVEAESALCAPSPDSRFVESYAC